MLTDIFLILTSCCNQHLPSSINIHKAKMKTHIATSHEAIVWFYNFLLPVSSSWFCLLVSISELVVVLYLVGWPKCYFFLNSNRGNRRNAPEYTSHSISPWWSGSITCFVLQFGDMRSLKWFSGILNFPLNRKILGRTKFTNPAGIEVTGMGNKIFSECIFDVTGKGATLTLMLLKKQNHVLVAVSISCC